MTSPALLDSLLQALINNDQTALEEIGANRSVEFLSLRALVSTDAPGAIPLDLDLEVSNNASVVPLFEGPRAFFISRHTSVMSRVTGGQSNVPVDYSLGFDSNFAEKLRGAVNGENINAVDRSSVVDIMMLKARNRRVQFDVLPFLLENTRLARSNTTNLRPLNTVIAFRMLDHLNWDAFRDDPHRFEFNKPAETLKAQLRPEAEAFITELCANPSVTHHEAKSLAVQALLLHFATQWHTVGRDPKRILTELLEFCAFELGFFPTTELSLIWLGISRKSIAPFLGPIVGRDKKMLARIRAMAWDMTHLRLMEKTATLSQFGSFFVPYFVSMDSRWRDLLRMNPVRLMLIDDAKRRVLFARKHEAAFQIECNECASQRVRDGRDPAKVAARRATASNISVDAMRQLVAREERPWL
jgi:hypothetical protein